MSAPLRLADEYLLAVRHHDEPATTRTREALAHLTADELRDGLPDDRARLAFWIDLYNGAVVQQEDIRLDSWPRRLAFLRRTVITVGGRPLTLDAIEHGILRRSRWKLGLGYVSNPVPSSFEREHRVDRLDPRIHFALNCAAASCPPIAAYEAGRIDAQLDVATRSYLHAGVEERPGLIRVPQLFLWYLGDFGGRAGIRAFLRHHGIDDDGRTLRFADYDWTPAPGVWVPDDEQDEGEA